MKILPAVIVAVLISATILALWLGPGYLNIGKTSEDTLALLHCTGDSFAFIQGTYLYPVTEEEIAAERQAVIQRFRAGGGQGPRAGGEGGGGPGEPRTIAWGYCIDDEGLSAEFSFAFGNDAPARDAIEESNRWYQEYILNRSLDRNATCRSRTVVERFRYTPWEMKRLE